MPTQRRVLGDIGEQLAADFLMKKGYALLEQNFLVREGEIDLIMQKGTELVFVEVKTRRNKAFGEIIESITEAKQEKLFTAIEQYFLKNKKWQEQDWRLDVITVDLSQKSPQIEHYPNAFS